MDSNPTASSKPIIPVKRINTIMKSSSDVDNVSRESSIIMAKAAELFIRTLCHEGYKETIKEDGKKLTYKHLAAVVHSKDKYTFLKDILPKKITVGEYKRIMAQQRKEESGESSDYTSSGGEEEEEEDKSSGSDR